MSPLIILFALLIIAAIAASAGWLSGYCAATRKHQQDFASLLGKAAFPDLTTIDSGAAVCTRHRSPASNPLPEVANHA